MTEFTIEKLVPIAGERIDFMEHLQQYKDRQSQKVIVEQATLSSPIDNPCETSCIRNKDSEDGKTTSSIITSAHNAVHLKTLTSLSVQEKLYSPCTSQQSLERDLYDPPTRNKDSEDGETTSSIITSAHNAVHLKPLTSLPVQEKLYSSCTSQQSLERDLYDPPTKRVKYNKYDLSALLQSSTCGKIVLGHFDTNACLNNNMRKVLADEIINNELSSNIYARMPTERIEFITKEIVKLFPSEIEAMWKGAYGGKPRRETSVGRGILLQRYYNVRRKLRKCGILSQESSAHTVEEFDTTDVEIDNATADDVQWLKNNSKPWVKVLELWETTNKSRLQWLIKNAIAVHDYIDSFPALKSANGYLLLEQDFNQMYPKSTMKLYSELPMLIAFIRKHISNEKERSNIEDSFNPEGKRTRTLLALNSLFAVITVWKKKKEQWRPSRQESREAFLLFVKTTNDILPTLILRKEKYIKYGLHLGVQAVIVGEDLDCIKYSYVVINELCYEVETPIKAIDIAFKAMHALDSKYPTECHREWLFLQRGVYEITTPHDKDISDVKVLALIEEYFKFKSLQL